MKNKKIIITLLISIMILTVSCGKKENVEEKQEFNKEIVSTINGFVDEMKEFNIAGLIKYASLNDISSEEINNIIPKDTLFNVEMDYLKNNAKNIEYNIESIKEKDNESIAKIKFKYNNIENVINNTLEEYYKNNPDNLNEEEKSELLKNSLEKAINSTEKVYITKIVKVDLIKIDGKWYIKELNNNLFNIMFSNYLDVFNKIENKN